MSPTFAPRRFSSSSDAIDAAADLVQVVVGLQPGDGLAVAAAVDVMVTWSPSIAGRSTSVSSPN